MSRTICLSQLLALIFLACAMTDAQAEPVPSSFDVEDLLALQAVERVALSSAGDRAAVTIVSSLADCARPNADGRTGYYFHRWRRQACGEIHIATATGLTRLAASDARGFFAPHWSPSGERLGFLSLDHNGDFHIWVWRPGSQPVQITTEAIDPEFSAWNSTTDSWAWSPFDWVDDTTIVTAFSDRGIFGVKRTPVPHPGEILEAGWAAQARGEEATADPLHADPSRMDFPSVALVRIDVDTSDTRELARGAFRAIRLSRSSSRALVSEVISDLRVDPTTPIVGTNRYRAAQALSSVTAHTRVGMVDLQGDGGVFWLDGVFDMAVSVRAPDDGTGRGTGFAPPQPVWSSDGSEVLFLGNSAPYLGAPPTVFLYDVESRNLTAMESGGNVVMSLSWVGDTPVYAQLLPESNGFGTCQVTWCVAKETPTNAFSPGSLPDDAPRILRPAGRDSAWFVHEGDVWAWMASSGTLLNLTSGRLGTVRSIDAVSPDRKAPTAVLQVDRSERRERLGVVYDRGGLAELGSWGKTDNPSLAAATISTTGRPGDLALYRARTADGIRIFAQAGIDDEVRELAWLNSHLAGLAQSTVVPLYYESRRGVSLSGFLALPIGFDDRETAPLVTYVYPNWMDADGATRHGQLMNVRFFMLPHLLTSAGYAVVFPYVPTEPPERAGPLCEQIADAVLPAIEAAVNTGYIDASAVGVMGHSYGGYTAASLMTCTDRFKAGVAVAGFYDLVSYPLSLKDRDRYNGHALGALSGLSETEQLATNYLFQFNRTPWQDISVYVDNSPIFNMDNLSIPLMLVHGELDGFDRAERMYVAGRRLNKDVTFVRYWGEYHSLYSPANIRDFWQRTIDFFDKNLGRARVAEADGVDFAGADATPPRAAEH